MLIFGQGCSSPLTNFTTPIVKSFGYLKYRSLNSSSSALWHMEKLHEIATRYKHVTHCNVLMLLSIGIFKFDEFNVSLKKKQTNKRQLKKN